jgi:flagellar operon protein
MATDPIGANPALLPPGVGPSIPVPPPAPPDAGGPSFGDVLAGQLAGTQQLRFSGHALERLERRGIAVDPQTVSRLSEGVGRAAAKGSRQSLVLVDRTAFVVSVPNRTVITAVGEDTIRDRVFTNIDSAVIG